MVPYGARLKKNDVGSVVLSGAGGKAFCAGGDIRSVTDSVAAGGALHEDFFKEGD